MSAFLYLFFFFNDTATTEIYTLSLHDALPIYLDLIADPAHQRRPAGPVVLGQRVLDGDDREVGEPLLIDGGHLVSGFGRTLPGVAAVVEELRAGHVQRQRDVGAEPEAGRLHGGGDQLQRGAVGRQVRGE